MSQFGSSLLSPNPSLGALLSVALPEAKPGQPLRPTSCAAADCPVLVPGVLVPGVLVAGMLFQVCWF